MPKLILLAEDDEDSALIYSAALRHFGYEVVHVANGVEVIDALRASRFDLTLLDISMPLLSGFDVCQLVKSDSQLKHNLIAMLTAHAMDHERERALSCGADTFIAKPIDPRALKDRIEALIGPP